MLMVKIPRTPLISLKYLLHFILIRQHLHIHGVVPKFLTCSLDSWRQRWALPSLLVPSYSPGTRVDAMVNLIRQPGEAMLPALAPDMVKC